MWCQIIRPVPEPREETFYDRVYAFVACVPAGRVVTYGQVAAEFGAPMASRAVGYALNNLSGSEHEIPWWRVVNASGGISLGRRGEAAAIQRERLEAEGVRFNLEGRLSLREFRWVAG